MARPEPTPAEKAAEQKKREEARWQKILLYYLNQFYHEEKEREMAKYRPKPVLLVFRAGGDGCELTAWTGRGLLARAFQYRAIHAFERLLGDRLQPGSPAQRKRKERRSEPEGSAEEAPEDTGQENGEAPDEEDSEA